MAHRAHSLICELIIAFAALVAGCQQDPAPSPTPHVPIQGASPEQRELADALTDQANALKEYQRAQTDAEKSKAMSKIVNDRRKLQELSARHPSATQPATRQVGQD